MAVITTAKANRVLTAVVPDLKSLCSIGKAIDLSLE